MANLEDIAGQPPQGMKPKRSLEDIVATPKDIAPGAKVTYTPPVDTNTTYDTTGANVTQGGAPPIATTQQGLWEANMKAGLQEDARRVKGFGQDLVDVVKGAGSTVSDVGHFLQEPVASDVGPFSTPTTQELQGTPYADPHHTAREMDSFVNRPAMEQLQVIGHGIAPETVPYPGEPKDQTPGLVTQLSLAKDRSIVPAVEGIQSHIGKPLVNVALARVGDENLPPEARRNLDAQELLFREAGTAFGGDAVGPKAEDPKTLSGINRLEDTLGVTGAAAAQSIAHEAGRLPYYLLSSGLGRAATAETEASVLASNGLSKAPQAARALAPVAVKEAAIEGFAQGTAQALTTRGADVVTAPVAGGIFGGLLGKGLATTTAEAKVMQHHAAVLPAESWDQFVNELDTVITRAGPTVRPGAGAGKGAHASMERISMDVASAKTKLGPTQEGGLVIQHGARKGVVVGPQTSEFDPTYVTVARNTDGVLVGREVQAQLIEGKVELTFRDTPLRTTEEARLWQSRAGKVYRGTGPSSAHNWKEFNVLALGDTKDLIPKGQVSYTEHYTAPETALQVPGVAKRVKQRQVEKLMAAEKGQLSGDATKSEAVVLNAAEDGKLKATPIADVPSKDPATWKLAQGDLVLTPDKEAYVVKGFKPDGRVLARKPGAGGNSRVFKNEDLFFVNDKEGLTNASMGPSRMPGVGIPEGEAAPIPEHINQIVDDFHSVTVPRLATKLGMNIGEAGQVINKLLSDGRIKVTKVAGVYDVVKATRLPDELRYEPWGNVPLVNEGGATVRAEGPVGFQGPKVPGFDEPVMDGLEVWYGIAPNGDPLKGVLRGPDPKTPNHYLLEVAHEGLVQKLEHVGALDKLPGTNIEGLKSGPGKTSMKSVPASALRTVVPVNLPKAQLRTLFQVPGLYGLTVPHPDGFVVTSKGHADAIQQAVSIANQTRLPALSKKVEALQGQLLNAYYLTPPMLRRKASPLFAAWPSARDSMVRISERMKEGVGSFGSQADQELLHVTESAHAMGQNVKALAAWAVKNPQASQEVMDTLRDLLSERKANSQWLADRGLASIDKLEQMRGAGEEPEYLTMMYNTHVLKDVYPQWVKQNAPKLWGDAVAELSRGTRNAAQVENELARIMRQDEPLRALAQSSLVDQKAFGKLVQRKDIASKYPAIYRLMGPVPSASLRLGHTIGYQRAIKASVEAWDGIAQSQWWAQGPREDLTLQIPNDPRFGAAAGGWTHKSLANFVNGKPEDAANSFARMLGFMGGKWKSFHTVYGGPTPWVNNVLRNLKGVALSGALEGPEDIEGFRRAPAMLLGWRKNPSMLGPFSVVGEAKQMSALSSGFAGAEIEDSRRRIQDELLRAMNKASGTASGLEDMVMAAQDFARTKSENIKDVYDAIDQYFKLASYINLKKKYLSQGHSIHDAGAHAAEDINAAYPNYELVGPLVERMRGKFGWVAPFLSSKAEDLRINAMTAARLARTANPLGDPALRDPGLALRLAGMSAALAGAKGLMTAMARTNGITDADIKNGENLLTLRQQSFRPALIPMWDYDEKGRMQFIDLTPMEDMLMMLRGNPQDPWLSRVLVNNATDLVGDNTWAGRGIQEKAVAAGLTTSMPQEMTKLGSGEGGVLNLLGDYARTGGVPQAPLRAMDAYQKTQSNPMNPGSETWSPTQALVKGLGLPYAGPVGPGSAIASLREAKGQVRELKREAKGVPRRLVDDQRANFLLEAKQRGLGATQDRINSIVPPPVKPGLPGGSK